MKVFKEIAATNKSGVEKLLPYIISFLLPGLNILNNSFNQDDFDFLKIAPRWLVASLFLLLQWNFNNKITYSKSRAFFIKAITGNIIITISFVLTYSLLFPQATLLLSTPHKWIIFLKFLITATVFLSIQYTLKASKTLENLRVENLSLKSENYLAQLQQLKKQVNPHFLFNTLSTLRSMIRTSHPNTENFVLNLSDVYRQLLQTREINTIALKEEINFLNAYLFLIQVRYEEALHIKQNIYTNALYYQIPVFALQLLVENCIKHNIISQQNPLFIEIFQKDETSITVTNNYQPKNVTTETTGTGLMNLKKRYELMGIREGVIVKQNDKEFSVTLKLF
ncbi:sensor histidine kinase [Abyssalbus ytuae]|uniref:Histidine kinase n=1 Tax=Abyssalbus ytuae TaxID=2926907 RepID=A0A9E6ZPH3_9FLAO|nr:histidine kinase [Abyssalbus ytuae]UOB18125.1 histidine kinase [Abyssalbus ytuae]